MHLRPFALILMLLSLSACRNSDDAPPAGSATPPPPVSQATTAPAVSPSATEAVPTLESLLRPDDTLATARARLGEAEVVEVELQGAEGETAPGWRLYPHQDERTVEVWLNESDRPQALYVRGSKSMWTRVDGVRLGLTTRELQAINGRPFKFFGFEWDYAGAISDWGGGTLAVEGGTRGPVVLCPPDPHPVDYPAGDSEFSSDDARVVASPAVVCEFGVNLDVAPAAAPAATGSA